MPPQWKRGAAIVLAAALTLAPGCDRYFDAVTSCSADPAHANCGPTVWPIPGHGANSDPWIASRRTVITEMRPKVLVLNFENAASGDDARAAAQRLAVALGEGSRYHGYADPNAPIFLRYEISAVVDLTDDPIPAGWGSPSSTRLPTDINGRFDATALFSSLFNEDYGFPAADDPARYLSLCELFEQGLVNEVWIMDGETGARAAPFNVDRKQMYDEQDVAIPGSFESRAGGGPSLEVACGVSVRLAHLDRAVGPGCDLMVRGWGIEDMERAIPSVRADARAFLNRDFDQRFGVDFRGWWEICSYGGPQCVSYPGPRIAEGTYSNGTSWRIEPFLQGCGATEFPPNARRMNETTNTMPVASRCESFGLGNGPGGLDQYDEYSYAKVAGLDADPRFQGCGGGWQIYWRQSVPGFRTNAKRADGSPMGNWWPYLFY